LLLLGACLDFDRYGEPSGGSGGGSPGSGAPPLGGSASAGGNGGEAGAPARLVCGDGVLDPGEVCDDGIGDPAYCVDCEVVCDGEDELLYVVSSHCYFLDPDGDLEWAEAVVACSSWRAGAYLAALETPAEQLFLEQLFLETIWLGGQANADDVWSWVNGEPFSFTNWDTDADQPDNGNNEGCMGVWDGGTQWHDIVCNESYPYLCEWQAPIQ